MRLFIKVGTKDKLVRKSEEGGGFVMAEVMITTDFELMVPDPEERKYWLELYPSWDPLFAAALDLLGACKAQHQAIDRLFAELIKRDETFFPSKSGQPWEAVEEGNAAIAKAEGRS
ncbi:hypothetical protein ES703_09384 [subsurface metagenome]